jgi:hypothetical protein
MLCASRRLPVRFLVSQLREQNDKHLEAPMSGIPTLHELLRTSRTVDDHSTRNPVRDRAKAVVCVVDGTPVQALLPASLVVNLERLLNLTGAAEIRLGRDDEAFGPCAAEHVFVDVRLALLSEVVFTTDTVTETVVMRWADFARSVRPIVGNFAEPPRDSVGAYRLSYRE